MTLRLTLLCGMIDLGFAAFHMLFWRLFGWPERLAPSGATNAAITQTLNIVLTLVFVMYGAALIWQGWHGVPATMLLWAGVVFGVVRAALQPLLFGLRRRSSLLMFVLICAATLLHLRAAVI